MPPEALNVSSFSADALEFIRLLEAHRVRYLIVGGEAVIFHGYLRLTGEIDFFYEAAAANTERLFACLGVFWNGAVPGVDKSEEFLEPGIVVQFGSAAKSNRFAQ